MNSFANALRAFHADLLNARTARHEEEIAKLMLPTTSWFGLRKSQLTREEAEFLHNESLEHRFIEVRGKRWIDEIDALLALEDLGIDPLTRTSNELVLALRTGGYL